MSELLIWSKINVNVSLCTFINKMRSTKEMIAIVPTFDPETLHEESRLGYAPDHFFFVGKNFFF